MDAHIEIIVDGETPDLSRVVWSFYLNDRLELYLDHYSEQARTTKRHGWKVVMFYQRIKYGRNYNPFNEMKEPPAVPDAIFERARKNILDRIKLASFVKK